MINIIFLFPKCPQMADTRRSFVCTRAAFSRSTIAAPSKRSRITDSENASRHRRGTTTLHYMMFKPGHFLHIPIIFIYFFVAKAAKNFYIYFISYASCVATSGPHIIAWHTHNVYVTSLHRLAWTCGHHRIFYIHISQSSLLWRHQLQWKGNSFMYLSL